MHDYSDKMRSMGFHRGNNYEMHIILERPEFEFEQLIHILDTTGLSYEFKKEFFAIKTDDFKYRIDFSNYLERNYCQLRIFQEVNEEPNWKKENGLLTVTYMIWSELAGKIPYEPGNGYYIDEWDKVFILNNIEIEDFERYYPYRLFSAKDLKNYPKSKISADVQLKIENKRDAYICSAAKKEFKSAFEFWIAGISELVRRGAANSDLSDGRFLPISKENLEFELNSLSSSLDLLLKEKTFQSAMKMRYDKVLTGWYFVESENQYHIIDLARPN